MMNLKKMLSKSGEGMRPVIAGVALGAVLTAVVPVSVFAATNGYTQYIGEDSARNIAREHAAVAVESTTYTKTRLEREDGIYVYDVNFTVGDTRFEYEVNAVTGEVQSFEKKTRRYQGDNGNSGNYIGEERAKEAALSNAGVAMEAVTFTKVKLDREDGTYVYEIDFRTVDNKYDYEVNAVNGDILSYEKKTYRNGGNGNGGNGVIVAPRPTPIPVSPAEYIGDENAKTIALNAAGLAESQTQRMKVKLDREKGVMVYEVEFRVDRMEYEYDINAVTGEILKTDIDGKKGNNGNGENNVTITPRPTPAPTNPADYIGEVSAKTIALNAAGLAESQVQRMKVKLDREKGIMVYEVEFKVGRMEYEYDIGATTGSIVKSKIDRD